jgi:secreted trypsin-like serine protease
MAQGDVELDTECELRSVQRLRIAIFLALALAISMVSYPSESFASQTTASPKPLITGGYLLDDGQLPWLVAIVDTTARTPQDGLVCTGNLVAPQWVLTAGHCLGGILGEGARVKVGVRSLDLDSADYVRADYAMRHPRWGTQRGRYDAALLHLQSPIYDIPPVALPSSADRRRWKAGRVVSSAGWGRDDFGQIPNRASRVELRVLPGSLCSTLWNAGRREYWAGQMLCAYAGRGRSTCDGDSGGPLFSGSGANARLLGLTSYGSRKCGQLWVPTVYTRVSSLQPWLNNVIQGATNGYPSAQIP